MAAWKLTVREGSRVGHESFDDLGAAVAEMRRRAGEVRGGERPGTVFAFRDYEPGRQVVARLEISGKGLLRAPTAGVDVMGDGSLVPFRGSMRRQVLSPAPRGDEFDAVLRALA